MFIIIIMNLFEEVYIVPARALHYILRDIDRRWWVRVKVRAAKEHKNIRSFILNAIDYYLRSVKAPKY